MHVIFTFTLLQFPPLLQWRSDISIGEGGGGGGGLQHPCSLPQCSQTHSCLKPTLLSSLSKQT